MKDIYSSENEVRPGNYANVSGLNEDGYTINSEVKSGVDFLGTAEKFTDLADTPNAYTGASGYFVKVNDVTSDRLNFIEKVEIDEVEGLQDALDLKTNDNTLAAVAKSGEHDDLINRNLADQHSIGSVTGLQDALNLKTNDNELSSVAKSGIHNELINRNAPGAHTISGISGLQDELDSNYNKYGISKQGEEPPNDGDIREQVARVVQDGLEDETYILDNQTDFTVMCKVAFNNVTLTNVFLSHRNASVNGFAFVYDSSVNRIQFRVYNNSVTTLYTIVENVVTDKQYFLSLTSSGTDLHVYNGEMLFIIPSDLMGAHTGTVVKSEAITSINDVYTYSLPLSTQEINHNLQVLSNDPFIQNKQLKNGTEVETYNTATNANLVYANGGLTVQTILDQKGTGLDVNSLNGQDVDVQNSLISPVSGTVMEGRTVKNYQISDDSSSGLSIVGGVYRFDASMSADSFFRNIDVPTNSTGKVIVNVISNTSDGTTTFSSAGSTNMFAANLVFSASELGIKSGVVTTSSILTTNLSTIISNGTTGFVDFTIFFEIGGTLPDEVVTQQPIQLFGLNHATPSLLGTTFQAVEDQTKPVFGGFGGVNVRLDQANGVVSDTRGSLEILPTYNWSILNDGANNYYFLATSNNNSDGNLSAQVCTHYESVSILSGNTNVGIDLANNNQIRWRPVDVEGGGTQPTLQEAMDILQDAVSSGNTVAVEYGSSVVETINLNPNEVPQSPIGDYTTFASDGVLPSSYSFTQLVKGTPLSVVEAQAILIDDLTTRVEALENA